MIPVVGGVILAGGLSRRMGSGDKSLMTLGGKPMIGHVVHRLVPQCVALAINANGDPQRFSAFGLPVLSDSIAGFAGPLAGILAGLDWASSEKMTHIVTAASDTPFFPSALCARLTEVNAGRSGSIILASSSGRTHPVFGLWPVSLRTDLASWMAQTQTRKVLAWVDRHDNDIVDFPPIRLGLSEIDPFFNANTPADLKHAEQLVNETNQ